MSGENRACVSCGKATFGQPECPHCKTRQPNKMKQGRPSNARRMSKQDGPVGLASFIGAELGVKATGKSPLLKPETDAPVEDVEFHTKDEASRKLSAGFAQMVVSGATPEDGKVLKPSEVRRSGAAGAVKHKLPGMIVPAKVAPVEEPAAEEAAPAEEGAAEEEAVEAAE